MARSICATHKIFAHYFARSGPADAVSQISNKPIGGFRHNLRPPPKADIVDDAGGWGRRDKDAGSERASISMCQLKESDVIFSSMIG